MESLEDSGTIQRSMDEGCEQRDRIALATLTPESEERVTGQGERERERETERGREGRGGEKARQLSVLGPNLVTVISPDLCFQVQ